MEHWWDGDRGSALKLFRAALKLDLQHADAHNHVGIASLEARKLKDAERHFRAAIEGGQRQLEYEGAKVMWEVIENRPYLRLRRSPSIGTGSSSTQATTRGCAS